MEQVLYKKLHECTDEEIKEQLINVWEELKGTLTVDALKDFESVGYVFVYDSTITREKFEQLIKEAYEKIK